MKAMGIVRYGATAAIRAAAKSGGAKQQRYPRQPGIVSFTEEMRDPGRAMREMRAAGQWGPPKAPRGTVAVPAAAVARPAAGPQAVTTMSSAPVDGARVLNQAYGYLGHMAVWPSAAAQITATLYAAAAHGQDPKTKLPVWQYMPRLFFTSREGGSGKSRMTGQTAALCPDAKRLVEPTKAALIGLIAKRGTICITELDVLLGSGRRNSGIVAVVNAGYEPDNLHTHKVGGKEVEIPLAGTVILDGLDSVITNTGVDLKTFVSRCVIVHVNRAPDGYKPVRFDREKRAIAAAINGRIARWMAQEVRDGIGEIVPEVPEGLGNRPLALWEPLFAVAEAAGGDWPAFARYACERIESSTGLPDDDEREAATIDHALDSWEAAGPAWPAVEE